MAKMLRIECCFDCKEWPGGGYRSPVSCPITGEILTTIDLVDPIQVNSEVGAYCPLPDAPSKSWERRNGFEEWWESCGPIYAAMQSKLFARIVWQAAVESEEDMAAKAQTRPEKECTCVPGHDAYAMKRLDMCPIHGRDPGAPEQPEVRDINEKRFSYNYNGDAYEVKP